MALDSARHRIRRVTPELVQRSRGLRKEATEAERVLWDALRGRQCGGLKFRRQHAVGTFILDFWCAELRLALEVDGGIHEQPEVKARDQEREREIRRHNVRVMRFRNEEVLESLDTVLTKILSLQKDPPLPEHPRNEELGRGVGGEGQG